MCLERCGARKPNRREFGLMLAALATIPVSAAGQAVPTVILRRQDWGAKPALPGLIPHQVEAIVVHNTAVAIQQSVSLARKMRGLQAFSQNTGRISGTGKFKPAWPDVPYHFYIDWQGVIAEGRDLAMKGDTNTNYETAGYAQIVLEGDFQRELPRAAQVESLRTLIVHVRDTVIRKPLPIFVHKDKAATTCPGKNLTPIVKALTF